MYTLLFYVSVYLFTGKLDLNLKKESSEIWSIALCGAETWTLRKTEQKYRESF